MPSSATCKLPCVSRTSPCSCSWRCTDFTGRTSCSRACATRRSSARCAKARRACRSTRSRDAAARHDPAAALQRGHRRRAPPRADGADGVPAREARDPGARRLDGREPPDGAREGRAAPRRSAGARRGHARRLGRRARHRLHPSHRPHRLQGRRARRGPRRSRRASSSRSSTPTSSRSRHFLRDLVPHFVATNAKVGMVQARWGHMNRDLSLLTRVQALMLDGHHLVENRARCGGGLALQLLRHRRHVAQGRHRAERRLAARHAHRGSRSLLPRADGGLELRLPRERRLARRAPRGRAARSARSSSAGPRAPCRRRAS